MSQQRPGVSREHRGAGSYVPRAAVTLTGLAAAAQHCRGCDLYERATQTVFGQGRKQAPMMLIGEQPGDAEDRQGTPFVGPAGKLLDRALAAAGIEPGTAYKTNAVKHFRWKPDSRGGKRRIHERPDTGQVRACRPWLDAELAALRPSVVVTLGATAGQALFGGSFRVNAQRGVPLPWPRADGSAEHGAGEHKVTVVSTIHPSAVLRAGDRDALFDGLVADLRVAAAELAA